MKIRGREEGDWAQVEALARVVHATDGYPVYLRGGDVRGFLDHPRSLDAWVAVDDDNVVVGHVALNAESSNAVSAVLSGAGIEPFDAGVVARLFVSPLHRRTGVAKMLLDQAVDGARTRGLHPVLDVVSSFGSAIRLYESQGWCRVGMATMVLPDGQQIEEVVFRAPARRSARVLVRNRHGRVLLFRISDELEPVPFWFTPGGGVDRGETLVTAAVRELAEETGIRVGESSFGDPVAVRSGMAVTSLLKGQLDETFFVLDVDLDADADIDRSGCDPVEANAIAAHRWWSIDELVATEETVYPPGLATLLRQLCSDPSTRTPDGPDAGRRWRQPVRLPWQS